MNKYKILAICLFIIIAVGVVGATYILPWKYLNKRAPASVTLKTGDLIFQGTTRGQGLAIQLATKSKYTHVGMIVVKEGKPFVYEAVGPVKLTPLSEFASHGDGNHYIVRRLKNDTLLNDSLLRVLVQKADGYKGKPYDIWFGWNDEHIYCSELIWKVYRQATGLEIGQLQKLREFDLSSPVVQAIITERYGDNVPYDETVISPDAVFNCPLLETVLEK